ncbi:MAG: MFS transporter [Chroococcidiopsidaceae cyanobacterium CP_BM_ER_R8_30]|nr:MFS transporter [Chroococcidiopsidaceae cyanobacterium CP_BM_ER_R8_30]
MVKARRKSHGSGSDAEPLQKNLDGRSKWWVLLPISLSAFMAGLDESIVNTLLPVLSRVFNCNVSTIVWVMTIYLLVVSGFLLSFGRLGDLRTHKVVYAWGLGVFILGSVLCGCATTPMILILFRAVQGLGAAMIFANTPAIISRNFPQQRGQALGMLATTVYLGLSLGPSVGGWLAEDFGWQVVFYINVPVGLLALWLSLRFIPPETPVEAEPFDWAGGLTFLSGLVALLLVLDQGHAWGWTAPITLLTFALSVLLLCVFTIIECRVAHPMLDLSLFKNRLFLAANVSAVLNYICLFIILFALPFYLITGRGLGSEQAGLLLITQPLIMAIVAPISGTLSDRFGSRLLAAFGMTILAVGLWKLSGLSPQSALKEVPLTLCVTGLGIGLFTSPNNNSIMGAAPPNRQGIASATLATARNIGMVLGVALPSAVLATVMSHSQGNTTALFLGIKASFWVATAIALLGALTSAVRGKSIVVSR